ncbi:alpha amylase [Pelomyxa schiedti]|nr:alpha amylase [Pelomyxa schiedti]
MQVEGNSATIRDNTVAGPVCGFLVFLLDGLLSTSQTYDFNDQLNILINQGFDFVYEKTILDRLKQCDLDEIRNWITYAETQTFWKHSAHFVENHDEDRSANVFSYNCDQVMCGGYPDCCGSICPADGYASCCDCNTCNDAANSASCCSATNCPGRSRAHMAAVVSMTLPGMRFFFQDQWEGYENKLDVHFRRAQPETPWTYTSDFYTKFNAIVKDSAFTSGTWTYLSVTGTTDCWRLMAWKWNYNGSSKRLVVVNFSDTSGSGYIVLSDVSGSGTVTITELFTGTQYQRSAEDLRSTGLIVVVSPWSSQIFQYP